MIKLSDILETKNIMRKDSTYVGSFRKYQAYNSFIRLLRKNCKQIIKLYEHGHGIYLYRGVKKHFDNIVKLNIRQNRVPGFLDEQMHALSNEVVEEMGGVAHRGNSIFCTTSTTNAKNWGQMYVVFPIDGFDVTYFTKEKDIYMYNDLDKIWKNWGDKPEQEIKKIVKDLYIERGISFDVEAIFEQREKKISEYLINGKFYYAIKAHDIDIGTNMNILLGDVAGDKR